MMNRYVLGGLFLLALCFSACNSNQNESGSAKSKKTKKIPDGYQATDTENVLIKTKFPAELEGFENLLGSWSYTNDSGRVHEETWSVKEDGLPKGMAQQKEDGTVVFEETMTIEKKENNMVLWISPQNQDPVPYTLKYQHKGQWMWHNPDHDFPKSLEYELIDDQTLKVRAMGAQNKEAVTMEFMMTKKG